MAPWLDERSSLLSNERIETSFTSPRRRILVFVLIVASVFVLIGGNRFITDDETTADVILRYPDTLNIIQAWAKDTAYSI